MAVDLSEVLVVGVTARALFNLEAENDIFEKEGVRKYREYQDKNQDVPLEMGTALYPEVFFMINVTRMNGTELTINAELIETIEEVPDTVIALTTGKKIIVKESRQKVVNLVKLYKNEIYCGNNIRIDG